MFSIKQRLARQVAESIPPALHARPEKRPHRAPVPSVAAYRAFLEATSHFLPTQADSTKSIEQLNLAIERDPRFAPSHAELALAYWRSVIWDYPLIMTFRRIEEYASRALQLNPELARGHSMMAAFYLFSARDWSKAERSCRRAIELNPSDHS